MKLNRYALLSCSIFGTRRVGSRQDGKCFRYREPRSESGKSRHSDSHRSPLDVGVRAPPRRSQQWQALRVRRREARAERRHPQGCCRWLPGNSSVKDRQHTIQQKLLILSVKRRVADEKLMQLIRIPPASTTVCGPEIVNDEHLAGNQEDLLFDLSQWKAALIKEGSLMFEGIELHSAEVSGLIAGPIHAPLERLQ